jgi:hypothetical protein
MGVTKCPEPKTQKALAIEDFISHMFEDQAKEDEEKIQKFNSEAGWVGAEIEHWKQRCEELEIELEVMRNAFPEDDHDVSPKRRGLF